MVVEIISGEHPFHINLSGKPVEVQSSSSYAGKIVSIGRGGLEFIARFFAALGVAALSTIRQSPRSFYRVMFLDMGPRSLHGIAPPRDIYLVLFRGAFWAVSLMVTFVKTVYTALFKERISSENFYVSSFAEQRINTRHIKTEKVNIDTGHLPAYITVRKLGEFFNRINFTDRDAPGHMSRADCTDDEGSVYSQVSMRQNLAIFIRRVEGREEFIGTPNFLANPRKFNRFHDQLGGAVRCVIYAVILPLEAFEAEHPDLENLEEAEKAEYERLLSEASQVVVNLAVTGRKCGIRYLAESMNWYYRFCGGEGVTGTLKESLEEVLAYERLRIARLEIRRKFDQDVHGWGSYMGEMGGVLAIPSSENIEEQIQRAVNREECLKDFFKIYTVDQIRQAVQHKVKEKNSQALRTQISDWFRSQVGDWRRAEFAALAAQNEQEVRAIMADATITVTDKQNEHLQMFSAILPLLQGVEMPDRELSWDAYVEELLALDPVRAWFQDQPGNLMERMQRKRDFKTFCQTPALSEILRAAIEAGAFDSSQVTGQLIELEKVRRIRNVVRIDPNVALIIARGGGNLRGAVRCFLEELRQAEFLAALRGLDQMQTAGLPPKLLEWLLVSQEVLLPQSEAPAAVGLPAPRRVSDSDIAYMWMVQNSMSRNDRERAQPFFRDGLDPEVFALFWANREGGQQGGGVRRCLEEMFNKAHERNKYEVERNIPQLPVWKRAFLIKIPKTLGTISDSSQLKAVLCVASVVALYFVSFIALNTVKHFSVAKLLPYMRVKAPETALKLGGRALAALHWPASNPIQLVFGGLVTGFILHMFSDQNSVVKSLADRLTPRRALSLILLPYQDLVVSVACLSATEGFVQSITNGATRVSHLFNGLASRAEQQRIKDARDRFVNVALAHNAARQAQQQQAAI